MTTEQNPIGSGFGAATTAQEVLRGIDLSGRTAIVTGGYSGLGLETVRALRKAGAEVTVPARDVRRAEAALSGTGAAVRFMDLLDPDSINVFADDFLSAGKPLHILVNSAGIMACPLARDARGNESQFSTNHLGHFALTRRLWPALLLARGARVVAVSSKGHRFSDVVYDDINFERRAYDPFLAYGQSKTANILFAVELDRRGRQHGVRAFAVHPGGIPDTNLGKHVSSDALKAAGVIDANGKAIINPAKDIKSIAQGAATQVWCAVHPGLAGLGGVYCEDSDIARLRGANENSDFSVGRASGGFGVMPYAVDPASAARLWAVSEKLLAE
jgi:NAD(P)-dependent dehydrogenase (short-subunit alcohol dehydrogenase family)